MARGVIQQVTLLTISWYVLYVACASSNRKYVCFIEKQTQQGSRTNNHDENTYIKVDFYQRLCPVSSSGANARDAIAT